VPIAFGGWTVSICLSDVRLFQTLLQLPRGPIIIIGVLWMTKIETADCGEH